MASSVPDALHLATVLMPLQRAREALQRVRSEIDAAQGALCDAAGHLAVAYHALIEAEEAARGREKT